MSTGRATRGYAICTEPRSGSNFLCQVLASTGLLGRPLEYFNTAGRRAFDDPAYPDDPEAQLEQVLSRGVTPNGVYGLKLFSRQSDTLAPRGWVARLPGLKFIHLERHDVLGQAISWAIAEQTQRYRAYAPGDGREARYDRLSIQSRLDEIVAGQARWRLYFARNGIEPLSLTYEELAGDPAGAAVRIGDFMGVGPIGAFAPTGVDLAIQRDATNAQWRERFVADAGDLSRLPRLAGAPGRLARLRGVLARLLSP